MYEDLEKKMRAERKSNKGFAYTLFMIGIFAFLGIVLLKQDVAGQVLCLSISMIFLYFGSVSMSRDSDIKEKYRIMDSRRSSAEGELNAKMAAWFNSIDMLK